MVPISNPGRRDIVGKSLGRYEILTELASGGMASVFVARAIGVAGFERLVAVKLLHPHLAHEAQFISMFLDEARLAARIHHPNVVPTLDISDTPDIGYFLVMQYVEGDHLGALIARAGKKGKTLPPRVVCKVVIDALDGLGAAHELVDDHGAPLNIVHRDVSPSNILVGADGVGRLTDFGVAKAEERITNTKTGQLKGKLAYMAPEHASTGDADQRSDIFSMGIVLWEALTGQRLFRRESNAATLNQILAEPILPPSSQSSDLAPFDEVLMKALDRDPEARFQTAEDFLEALERVARAHCGVATTREVAKLTRKLVHKRLQKQKSRIDAAVAELGHRDLASRPERMTAPGQLADRQWPADGSGARHSNAPAVSGTAKLMGGLTFLVLLAVTLILAMGGTGSTDDRGAAAEQSADTDSSTIAVTAPTTDMAPEPNPSNAAVTQQAAASMAADLPGEDAAEGTAETTEDEAEVAAPPPRDSTATEQASAATSVDAGIAPAPPRAGQTTVMTTMSTPMRNGTRRRRRRQRINWMDF